MGVKVEGAHVYLSGDVGDFGEDCFASIDVISALAEVPPTQRPTIHINSGGGVATEGAAIYAILSGRTSKVDVIVEGVAASAASLIAMAGDTVTMSAGSVMMIHDPSGITLGTSADHRKTIEGLEALAASYAAVYAGKSGKTLAECRSIMQAETWLTPEEAVEAGFADRVQASSALYPVAAHDYLQYAKAPTALVAMAKAHNWTASGNSKTKEKVVSDKTVSGAAHATATARIKSIMQAPEAEGREKLAEHLAFDTTMDAEAALAILKVAPVAAQADDDIALLEARRLGSDYRLNGEGLNGSRSFKSETGIVAAMKQRHAAK